MPGSVQCSARPHVFTSEPAVPFGCLSTNPSHRDVSIDKQMLLVNADFEEYLREAMEKLRIEQEASFKELVKTCPGLEAILEMADPRTRDVSLA